MTRETQPTEAQARLLMTPDQFAEWKRDRDARAAFWKNAISQQPADPEGTNAQLLANALSRAEIAENDLRAEILHSGKMRERAESAERDDSKTRDAIGERFCLVPPDGGDVKTWEAAAEMRKALESAERDLAAALEREAEANRQLSMCRHEYDVNKRIWQSERDAALERVGRLEGALHEKHADQLCWISDLDRIGCKFVAGPKEAIAEAQRYADAFPGNTVRVFMEITSAYRARTTLEGRDG